MRFIKTGPRALHMLRDRVAPQRSRLPRLLYLGDVPVESSYHGSALLFRLFQEWPPEKLQILESDLQLSQPARRLPGVGYAALRVGWDRLLYTRFASWYGAWLSWTAAGRIRQIESLLNGFEPQAVVTVTHRFSWLTAAAFARQRGLPLHVICHDDLLRVVNAPGSYASWLDRQFAEVYRSAASRFCVSPFMRDAYRERYGSDGTVLYPSRSADCPDFDAPPQRSTLNGHPFTIAFGGSINSPGYALALTTLATALEPLGGRLLVFGPHAVRGSQQMGLSRPNVTLCGLLPSTELMARFREEVDALFVPMSFDLSERANMESSFPSKLTDYTAIGLPLLIYGPPWCSAVRWARDNEGVGEVVTEEHVNALNAAVKKLAGDPVYRCQLGVNALRKGREYFSHHKVREQFYRSIGLSA